MNKYDEIKYYSKKMEKSKKINKICVRHTIHAHSKKNEKDKEQFLY